VWMRHDGDHVVIYVEDCRWCVRKLTLTYGRAGAGNARAGGELDRGPSSDWSGKSSSPSFASGSQRRRFERPFGAWERVQDLYFSLDVSPVEDVVALCPEGGLRAIPRPDPVKDFGQVRFDGFFADSQSPRDLLVHQAQRK